MTTRRRALLTVSAVALCLIGVADALCIFPPKSLKKGRCSNGLLCMDKSSNRCFPRSCSSSQLCMSDSSSSSDDKSPEPRPSVRQAWEEQREEARVVLGRLDSLEATIQADANSSKEVSEEVKAQVQEIQTQIENWDKTLEGIILPAGVSMETVERMVGILWGLPFAVRLTILDAFGFDPKLVADPDTYPAVVSKMLESEPSPSQWEVARSRTDEQVRKLEERLLGGRSTGSTTVIENESKDEAAETVVMNWIDTLEQTARMVDKNADFTDARNRMKYRNNGWYNYLPRVLMTSKRKVDQSQLRIVEKAFAKDVFVPTGVPEEICQSGGYFIEGKTPKGTGAELIAALDKKLDGVFGKEADGAERPSVCYVEYPTTSTLANAQLDKEDPMEVLSRLQSPPILIVFDKDMSPQTNPFLKISSNLVSVVTALYFCYDAYARNLGDEFLSKTPPETVASLFLGILGPLFFIQLLHEGAHLLVAKMNGTKTTLPTFLPFVTYLPFFGCKTEFKESPKNRTVLFDFAFVGPFVGIVSSLIFLLLGAQNTLLASPQEISETFPAIPVSWIQLSTLSGTILDTMFGGQGMATSAADNGQVALHPFAIAGWCGLLANSLELIPAGNSDGGRLTHTLFGRENNRALIALTWLIVIVASFFAVDDTFDLLLGTLIIFQVTNQDPEIPCRNEVDPVGPFRALAALGLFFLAILIAFPMNPYSGGSSTDPTMGMM